jgi:hypothetical protein
LTTLRTKHHNFFEDYCRWFAIVSDDQVVFVKSTNTEQLVDFVWSSCCLRELRSADLFKDCGSRSATTKHVQQTQLTRCN